MDVDPTVMNFVLLRLGHRRQALIQDTHQLRPVVAHGKGQLKSIGRRRSDL